MMRRMPRAAERGDAGVVELGEIARAVEHARAGARRARGQAADVAEVDGAGNDGIERVWSPGRARGGVAVLSGQIVARRDAVAAGDRDAVEGVDRDEDPAQRRRTPVSLRMPPTRL